MTYSFEILTVVPEAAEGYLGASILGRAAEAGSVAFSITNIRDFAEGRHKQVDDAPFGGGQGMVMKPEPVVSAIEAARARAAQGARVHTILLGPAGQPFEQQDAARLARDHDHLVLVCGRYEGIDDRVTGFVDEEFSLGDFVITGGELAALAIVDAVARLLPNVLGNDLSAGEESFQGPLLEFPHYTRPRVFRGIEVPEVLLSGDHGRIATWREEQALRRTKQRRPDLLKGTKHDEEASSIA